jgi:hypothetical protein
MFVVIAFAMGLVIRVESANAGAPERYRDCGDVVLPTGGTSQLFVRGVRCDEARELLDGWLATAGEPPGWRCELLATVVCWSGSSSYENAPRVIEAWPRPPAADGRTLVIVGDTRLGPYRITQSLGRAREVFGFPTYRRPHHFFNCEMRWARLGLRIHFAGTNPCQHTMGFYGAEITGEQWRTSKGLRIGDPVSRLRQLYPSARYRTGAGRPAGWWLIVRTAVGGRYPALLARTRNDRVIGFDVSPRGVF